MVAVMKPLMDCTKMGFAFPAKVLFSMVTFDHINNGLFEVLEMNETLLR